MKITVSLSAIIATIALLSATNVQADLNPGDPLPNPTLTDQSGAELSLHTLLKKVTVLHLWKCN